MGYMGQAHKLGIRRGGRVNITKVLYGLIFRNVCCSHDFVIHIYCQLGILNGVIII